MIDLYDQSDTTLSERSARDARTSIDTMNEEEEWVSPPDDKNRIQA